MRSGGRPEARAADLVVKQRQDEDDGGLMGRWWEQMHLFEREVEFYAKVRPRMEEIMS